MKQFELNGKTICFVEVPSDAYNLIIRQNFEQSDLWYTQDLAITNVSNWNNLIGTGWKFLCLSKDMTEEVAKTIMPGISTAQLDGVWYSIGKGEKYCYDTALESFRSFEQSVGVVSVNPYEKSDECTCHICSEYCNWCEDDFDGIEYNEAQNEVKNYAILIK